MAEDTNNTANGPAPAPSEGGGTPAPKTYTEAEYNALQSSLDAVNKQLAEANNTIKSYTDMDIDGIKKSAEDWKQKAEKLEAEQKAQEFSSKLDKFVQAQGMRNDIYAAHLKSLLTDAELKFDKEGTLIGGEDIVKKLKESCPDAVADTRPKPEFVGSTPGSTPKSPDDDYIRKVMGLK